MQYTREAALNRLMESYKAYFNIDMTDNTQEYLRAVCEFFEHTEKYVLSRQEPVGGQLRGVCIFIQRGTAYRRNI